MSVLVYYIGNDFFSGGNDSEYYHAYALGYVDVAVNAWPTVLRWLNDLGLYSRVGVSHFLKVIGFVAIPFLVGRLTYVKDSPVRNRIFWAAAVVMGAYPTLIYYTTDIYRDVFMVFLWVLGLFVYKALSQRPNLPKALSWFILGLATAYILYEFRPYLGLGYLAPLVLAAFYSFRTYPLLLTLCSLVAILFGLFWGGVLEPVLAYRSMFREDLAGGSNLGITFSSSADFLPDLVLSISLQLFGVFFVNPASVLVFITESLPFIAFFVYVVKNRRFSTRFVDYLIIFFVVYSAVWLLGNDNLGTAVRLRMFSYISILIAFFIIYQNKKVFLLSHNREPYCSDA